jgi:uncharacterized protein YbcC (UPF0753/DUF2309 family)
MHSNVVADLLLEKSKRDMADSYHHYDVRPMSDAIIDEQGFGIVQLDRN